MTIFTIASALLLGAAAPADVACTEMPGWEQVAARDEIRWIILGEIHGTNEIPAVFADLVCLASSERPVAVAVEQPASEQRAVDAYIASDGGEEATAVLLASPMWHGQMKDGRSSEAYFRLFERLRELREAGRVVSVIAFQPDEFPNGYPGPAGNEEMMAKVLKERAPAGVPVLVLVGNMHAMLTEVRFPGRSYMPMASYLPADETITLDARSQGGSSWACFGPDTCGPGALGAVPGEHERGLVLEEGEGQSYSGALYLGRPATASPPK